MAIKTQQEEERPLLEIQTTQRSQSVWTREKTVAHEAVGTGSERGRESLVKRQAMPTVPSPPPTGARD